MVSVVVIAYNQENIICETLDSIYQQSYSPLELIVTDDCSKDNTVAVVKRWISSHEDRFVNVQVLESNTNTGVTANCNRGLSAANGEYLQLIAGDDILLPDALAEKVTFAEARGLNYVVSKVEPFGEDPERVDEITRWCEEGYRIIKAGYDAQVNAILKFNFIAGPCGSFFRLNWLKEQGAFDERYPMMEDFPFIFHYIISGNEIQMLDKELARYRVYKGSVSSAPQSPMWKSNWNFFFHECFPEIIRRHKVGTAVYMLCYYVYSRFIKGKAIDRLIVKKLRHLKSANS